MSRTSYFSLAVLALISGVLGWALQVILVSTGQSLFVFPVTMAWTLGFCFVVLAFASLLLRSRTQKVLNLIRQNPWFGFRTLIFAKSGSNAGTIFLGVAGGSLIYISGRPVFSLGAFLPTLSVFVSAFLLIISGIVAEKSCLIRSDNRGDKNA